MGRACVAVCLVAMVGCGPDSLENPHTWTQQAQSVYFPRQYRLDLLLVIDDSPKMAGNQERVATAAATFARMIEQAGDGYYYRIGVTTTSVTQPGCTGSAAVDGALLADSCRAHLGDFAVGPDELDDQAVCLEHCPSAIALDPSVVYPRTIATANPWIDNTTENATLPRDAAGADALACVATRGSAGCAHPAPLEAMRLALERMEDPDDPAFGFRRDGAIFMVVFITNGHECSFSDAATSRVGPETPQGVCWTAGVRCDRAPEGRTECTPEDLGADGSVTSPESAVMVPVSTYIDALQRIEDRKQASQPRAEVVVATIAGVAKDGSLVYQDSLDETFQAEFGIGPGCSAALGGTALPPARLAAFAEAFAYTDHQLLHSFCASDWSGALADSLLARLALGRPQSCVELCIADQDLSTPQLDASCVVRQSGWNDAGPFVDVIEECEVYPSDARLPEGEDVCWHLKTGDEATPGCSEDGWPELGLLRAPNTYVPSGSFEIECLVSAAPSRDCSAPEG